MPKSLRAAVRRCLVPLLAGLLLASASASTAHADARSDYLIQLLAGSSQFRVRAQAAISLGGIADDAAVVAALSQALKDEHPAVRAAAASSLGRLGDRTALSALRAAANDPEPPVRTAAQGAVSRIEAATRGGDSPKPATPSAPSGPPRFYVAVPAPSSRATALSANDLRSAHDALRARVQEIDGVVLAPANESNAAAQQALKKQRLKGYYLESSVTSIEDKPGGGVRAVVSLVVATYPGRDMRAVMQGAATAMGGGDVKTQAIEAAFKSAVRQLPQAMNRD